MKVIEKIKKYLYKPKFLKLKLDRSNIMRMDDKTYIELCFEENLGYKLDWNNIQTFNEKLQWLKLYNKNAFYTNMVDKYEVKKIIENKMGKEYVIPTIGVYNSWDEINFNSLPDKFVIKCTHDSGGVFICTNKEKLNKKSLRNRINKKLKRNFFYNAREWPYKNVRPRIIIEKYMIDEYTSELRDYKFFCFNGKVKFFKIDFNRFTNHQANYYDTDGNLLEFGEKVCPPDFNAKLNMPYNLKKMIKLAEKISHNVPFIRVDFYEINKKIFFGEFTFYPAGGFGKFIPEKWDKIIGDMLELPNKL